MKNIVGIIFAVSMGGLLSASSFAQSGGGYRPPPVRDEAEFFIDSVKRKYNTSSCEELLTDKHSVAHGQGGLEERLRKDSKMRDAFLEQVAMPIAKKLLDCGFIP